LFVTLLLSQVIYPEGTNVVEGKKKVKNVDLYSASSRTP